MKKASPPLLPLWVTIPLPWHSLRVRAIIDLLAVSCNTTTLGPSGTLSPTMASADSRSLAFLSHSAFASLTGPPGVRHNSFAAQPPDLLLRFYVYLSGFVLFCILAYRLALYPVSVRRLAGFATPLPPLLSLLTAACGSLHLAVNTRDRTFTCENFAMSGTQKKGSLDNKAAWINYLRLHGEPSLVHSFLSEQINKGLSKCISDKKSKTDLNNKPNNGYR